MIVQMLAVDMRRHEDFAVAKLLGEFTTDLVNDLRRDLFVGRERLHILIEPRRSAWMLPQLLRCDEGFMGKLRHTVDARYEAQLLVKLHLVRLNAVVEEPLLRADGLLCFGDILNDCRQTHLQS